MRANRRVFCVLALALSACGGSNDDHDSGVVVDSGSGADAGAQTDSGAHTDAGAAIDSGLDAGGDTPDAGGGDTTYMLAPGDCFTFATATSAHSGGTACGDLLALSGANVDLATGPGSGICDLTGTFASVDDVPTSYASCAWSSYLEGGDPLIDHGMIVRDATETHHYRVRIVNNAHPAMIFAFAQID